MRGNNPYRERKAKRDKPPKPRKPKLPRGRPAECIPIRYEDDIPIYDELETADELYPKQEKLIDTDSIVLDGYKLFETLPHQCSSLIDLRLNEMSYSQLQQLLCILKPNGKVIMGNGGEMTPNTAERREAERPKILEITLEPKVRNKLKFLEILTAVKDLKLREVMAIRGSTAQYAAIKTMLWRHLGGLRGSGIKTTTEQKGADSSLIIWRIGK